MIIPLISLDTETTGLEPAVNAPWEVAWTTALHDTGASTLTLYRSQSHLLTLAENVQMHPIALRVSKFAERYLADDTPGERYPIEVIALLASDCENINDDCRIIADALTDSRCTVLHLIGAVPQFDHRMLERWLGWAHPMWSYHLIDVETLLAGALKITPPFNTYELTDRAMEILGVVWDDSRKHEAAHDVSWNLHLYAAAYGLRIVDQ